MDEPVDCVNREGLDLSAADKQPSNEEEKRKQGWKNDRILSYMCQ